MMIHILGEDFEIGTKIEIVLNQISSIHIFLNFIKNTLYCIDVIAKAITQLVNGEPVQKIGIPDTTYIKKMLYVQHLAKTG